MRASEKRLQQRAADHPNHRPGQRHRRADRYRFHDSDRGSGRQPLRTGRGIDRPARFGDQGAGGQDEKEGAPINLYEPLLERDEAAIRAAIRDFRRTHSSDQLFGLVTQFAILSYAPSQHAKHAVICCLAAHDLREELAQRYDDVLTECAIYAAMSRQPWSEPPITDPPAVDADQRGDVGELRESVASGDRLRAERWLARRLGDADFAHDYFAVACDDFGDLGHKLIVAVTAWRLAQMFPPYPTLRVGVWEMTAYREGAPSPLSPGVIERMIAGDGDIVSAHAVFLLDAALQSGDPEVIARAGAGFHRPGQKRNQKVAYAPVYRLARDCGAYLKSVAVARRLGDERIIAAAHYNLEHAPSLEEFSFA